LEEAREIFVSCLREIVNGTAGLERVEAHLFPDLREKWQRDAGQGKPRRCLLAVGWQEDHVQDLCKEAEAIFNANFAGPEKYVGLYEEYKELLDGEAERDRDLFLRDTDVADLEAYEGRMAVYERLRRRIRDVRGRATLNLFLLDCRELNAAMEGLCGRLHESLIGHQVETNRMWNRGICDRFDEMATRLGEIPDQTKELVDLQRYLRISMAETMPGLMSKIATATKRVLFLLDCTVLPAEDIQLNTRVFQWPKDMASVFELAKTRTGHRRDQVEEELRARIDKFEAFLKKASKELEVFMKKDPPVLTLDEMRASVVTVDRLNARAKEAVEKLAEINKEEVHLDWDPSKYALLDQVNKSVFFLFTNRASTICRRWPMLTCLANFGTWP